MSGLKTKSSVSVSTPGWTAEATRASGRTTIWRAWVFISGMMVGPTMESILMTRSMDLAYTDGKTVVNTKATGTMANNTGLESTKSPLKTERSSACGKTANESSGSAKRVKPKSTAGK